MKLVLKHMLILTLSLHLMQGEALALNLTQKQKSYLMIFACSVGTAIIADQLGKAGGSDSYNSTGTMGMSGMFGGAACMAYDMIFEPFPSKESHLEKKLVQYEALHRKMGLKLTEQAYDLDKPTKLDLYDQMEMQNALVGDEAFNQMVSEDCKYQGLELGGKALRGKEVYVPVSKNIIMKGFEYYIVYPKNRKVSKNPCVTPLAGSDYLNKEIPGLGKALYIEGIKQVNKKRKLKKSTKSKGNI